MPVDHSILSVHVWAFSGFFKTKKYCRIDLPLPNLVHDCGKDIELQDI